MPSFLIEFVRILQMVPGQVRVRVEETFYGMDVRHREEKEGALDQKCSPARSWMCLLSGADNVCVNVSRRWESKGPAELHVQLSHVCALLNAAGKRERSYDLLERRKKDLGRRSYSMTVG